ncbi:hypothetical protein RRG08_043553 [Elysia crispata]|uniref:Uncharacterized protein n=1 Tax=Elysia crispata TaxID=231223 RepID=A0AAE1CXQ7_9GAST|nr:hypothetical protein RRG08_043553 [Elysia crispata]
MGKDQRKARSEDGPVSGEEAGLNCRRPRSIIYINIAKGKPPNNKCHREFERMFLFYVNRSKQRRGAHFGPAQWRGQQEILLVASFLELPIGLVSFVPNRNLIKQP